MNYIKVWREGDDKKWGNVTHNQISNISDSFDSIPCYGNAVRTLIDDKVFHTLDDKKKDNNIIDLENGLSITNVPYFEESIFDIKERIFRVMFNLPNGKNKAGYDFLKLLKKISNAKHSYRSSDVIENFYNISSLIRLSKSLTDGQDMILSNIVELIEEYDEMFAKCSDTLYGSKDNIVKSISKFQFIKNDFTEWFEKYFCEENTDLENRSYAKFNLIGGSEQNEKTQMYKLENFKDTYISCIDAAINELENIKGLRTS